MLIMTLARLASAHAADVLPAGCAQFVLAEATVALPLGDVIDFAKERARLEKELKKRRTRSRDSTPSCPTSSSCRARPEDVLAEQREKRADAAALAARLREAVARLA